MLMTDEGYNSFSGGWPLPLQDTFFVIHILLK